MELKIKLLVPLSHVSENAKIIEKKLLYVLLKVKKELMLNVLKK